MIMTKISNPAEESGLKKGTRGYRSAGMNLKLVIIDDNSELVWVLKQKLAPYGYTQIEVARDGERGYDLVQEARPLAVICGAIVPKMHGFDLCEKLRANRYTQHIPVILLCHSVNDAMRSWAFRSRVTELLPIPVPFSRLLEAIGEFAARQRSFEKKAEPVSDIRMDNGVDSAPLPRIVSNLDRSTAVNLP